MERKKPALVRKIWRITPQAQQGEFVDFDPTVPKPAPSTGTTPKVLDPAPVEDWRSSSYDLLNGLEVRDHTDSIPGELFDRIFKH
jgi:hypothetical protein